jgi:hypothetical protein
MAKLDAKMFIRESDATGNMFLKEIINPAGAGKVGDTLLDNRLEDPSGHQRW